MSPITPTLFFRHLRFLSSIIFFCSLKRTGKPLKESCYFQANAKAAAAVERLTDVSKYTGSHKQRFDEAGKGKGIAGRKDVQDGSGYVQGYKDKDTYNKTH